MRELIPVACCLIKHEDKFRVGEHGTCRIGFQAVFNVLRDTCRDTAPLSCSFVKLIEEVRAFFISEKKINLVYVYSRSDTPVTVADDFVPQIFKNDHHAEGFELFAQILDIVHNDTVVDVHVAGIGECLHRAVYIKLQRHIKGFGFFRCLLLKDIVIVRKSGHFLCLTHHVVLVNFMQAVVDDCALFRRYSGTSHYRFEERKEEIILAAYRILIICAEHLRCYFQRVEVRGTAFGDVYKLAA